MARYAIKPFEDLPKGVGRDAYPEIPDADGDLFRSVAHAHHDHLCLRGILNGIAQKIDDDLSKAVLIPDQLTRCCSLDDDAMLRSGELDVLNDLAHQVVHHYELLCEYEFARLHLRNVEQVGDEPGELLELGVHLRHILDSLLAALPLQQQAQQVRVALQAGQGSP